MEQQRAAINKKNVHIGPQIYISIGPQIYITIMFGKATVLYCMTRTDTCNKQGPLPLTREVYIGKLTLDLAESLCFPLGI